VALAEPMPAKIPALWNMTQLVPALRRDRVDILHSQYMLPPYGGVPCRMVVTIHDASFRLYPQWFPKHENRVQNFLIPIAARRADRIVTVSESAAADIFQAFGIDRSKIAVTPNGVGPGFAPGPADPAVLRKLGVTGPYVVGVGILRKRKNAAVVLQAIDRLIERGRWPQGLTLALTGGWEGDADAAAVYKEKPRLKDVVRTLGYISDDDLPALYRAAVVSVYPSLYEGFGLPVVEAMASGVPILAANTSALPEVVGRAGLLLPFDEPDAWADALNTLFSDESVRKDLIERRIAHARLFSWDKTARLTLNVYRELVGSTR